MILFVEDIHSYIDLTNYLYFQNSMNKCHKHNPDTETRGKKKTFVKNLAWKKSFAQFLRRKRYHSPVPMTTQPQQHQPLTYQPPLLQQTTHQQHTSHGNNNNNDFQPSPPPELRNGIPLPAMVIQPSKVSDSSTGAEDHVISSHEGDNGKINPFPSAPMETAISGDYLYWFVYFYNLQSTPQKLFQLGFFVKIIISSESEVMHQFLVFIELKSASASEPPSSRRRTLVQHSHNWESTVAWVQWLYFIVCFLFLLLLNVVATCLLSFFHKSHLDVIIVSNISYHKSI